MALPEGIAGLTGLQTLNVCGNEELTALPVGLCALARLEELYMEVCGLEALAQEMSEGLTGLQKLDLNYNTGLTALPVGFGRLRKLEELHLNFCPWLAALHDLHEWEGLPALLAHFATQGEELAAGEAD
jgi:Leucine-rich repeat (LRR) protein